MLSPFHLSAAATAAGAQRTPPYPSSNAEPPTQTQLTEIMTQQEFSSSTQDDSLLLSSPIFPQPLGKLLPTCGALPPLILMAHQHFTIGRSDKCDSTVRLPPESQTNPSKRKRNNWGFGLISNRHCTVSCTETTVTLTDHSGNGTTLRRNGSKLILQKNSEALQNGDEICLLNTDIIRKKIRGPELHDILQWYSYVCVLTPPVVASCVRVRELAPSVIPMVNGLQGTIPENDASNIIGDYIVSHVLGTGTVGEVRKGVHRTTGVEVAIKILRKSQLEAEAAILKQLDHPYIIRLVDVYEDTTMVYLVMELMECDLFEKVRDLGKYTEVQARYILRRLLAALHYLHEHKQIVHRDLKPENILCQKSHDIIKLTDFGLAKKDGRLKTFCGTPQYFAPEVLKRAHTVLGNGSYGKPADLYSLGVILHVMLTGFTPQISSSNEIVWDPTEDRHLSEASKDIVRTLLHPNPSVRATVVQACDHPWMLVDDGDTHRHPLDDPLLPDAQRRTQTEASPQTTDDAMDQLCDIAKEASPCKAKMIQRTSSRRPLSPFNVKSSKPGTPSTQQMRSGADTVQHHQSITPGSTAKELTDDESSSTIRRNTESIGAFETTKNDEGASKGDSKPRRVSEMQSADDTTEKPPKKRICTKSAKKNNKKKQLGTSHGQKSLKSFFSPTKPPSLT